MRFHDFPEIANIDRGKGRGEGREEGARQREYATHLSTPQHVTAPRHTEVEYPGADLSW